MLLSTSTASAEQLRSISSTGNASTSTTTNASSTTAAAANPDDGETVDLDAGGEFGYTRLDGINFLAPTPTADLRLHNLQAAIRIPLRIDPDTGDLRQKDWDESSDYFRLGQCVRFDMSASQRFERERGLCQHWQIPRDDYYVTFRLGPVQDFSLGHGTILNGYSNTLNPDHFQAGVVGQMQFHQFVLGNFLVDNVTNPTLIAGALALRPFSYELEETAEWYEERHQLQVQLSAVSDLQAPDQVQSAFGMALTDGDANLLYSTRPLTVVGGDFEWKYVFGKQIEMEAHLDWNAITGHGMGAHAQAWFTYNHPDGLYSVHSVGEARYIQRNYIPNYIDSYYFIQRQQYALTDRARAAFNSTDDPFVTKAQFLEQLDADSGWDPGYYLGMNFEVYKGSGEQRRKAVFGRLYIADTIGRSQDGQFLASLSIPRLSEKIDVHALYSRLSFAKVVDIFKLDNTLVKVLVRWDLNQDFYLLMNYGRIWQLRTSTDAMTDTGFQSNNEFNISLGFQETLAGTVGGQ